MIKPVPGGSPLQFISMAQLEKRYYVHVLFQLSPQQHSRSKRMSSKATMHTHRPSIPCPPRRPQCLPPLSPTQHLLHFTSSTPDSDTHISPFLSPCRLSRIEFFHCSHRSHCSLGRLYSAYLSTRSRAAKPSHSSYLSHSSRHSVLAWFFHCLYCVSGSNCATSSHVESSRKICCSNAAFCRSLSRTNRNTLAPSGHFSPILSNFRLSCLFLRLPDTRHYRRPDSCSFRFVSACISGICLHPRLLSGLSPYLYIVASFLLGGI